MKKAVIIFSGGLDSMCTAAYLKPNYELYGISYLYGQRANKEIQIAKKFAKKLLRQHRIVDISFMREIYGKSNVLTDSKRKLPKEFQYSIVVPIRNAIFLSVATAWAFTINASLVAYGAHAGDKFYPDCRPNFANKLESALNEGEIDGIKSGLRQPVEIWSPYKSKFSKSTLLKSGYKMLDKSIFDTWSCYESRKIHCGKCESCVNRKRAFVSAGVTDLTLYQN
ncbi:MAG: 7-cyano-7-deazaguanine synthase [Nitrosopumilaceae archaeon]|nr:7-cyano-7-deazaguanine synthase [Nitrosopumilaceae archaeon]NIU01868.1 7-cyano-7-deazaguanine synthase [Nitrosopumilaceae archaeon]NIU88272.1 7-cyano-7-deazaguanine synthase [Nitrosopumilaceae archaeon]NIV66564.1 7-cyano-7-deazaguanine synthase [Nitrosopumilaceae archaeon]NIX62469.1 7-cyano-7-deazaguanine synthase [Nitrosopumilaceae archaeon]